MSSEESFKLLKHIAGLSFSKEVLIFCITSAFGIIVILKLYNIGLGFKLLNLFSSDLDIFTATCLTILALFTTCVYSVKNSAENNMHNASTSYFTSYLQSKKNNKETKKLFEESKSWKELCMKNIAVTTNWFYSFIVMGILFLVSIFFNILVSILFDINRNYLYLIPITVIILLWLSIWKFLKGFGCLSLNAEDFSGKRSWINFFSGLFGQAILAYTCEPRNYKEFDEYFQNNFNFKNLEDK